MRAPVRVLVVAAAVALFGAFSASAASASSAHFKKGGSPVCSVTGQGTTSLSTTCSASLSGLGNGDLAVNVTVSGFAVYQCQNNGGNVAPGQNRVLEGPSTTPTTIPADQIKNGPVTFTTNPADFDRRANGLGRCRGGPSPNWTGVNPIVTVTSIEMTIAQGGVQLFDCTALERGAVSRSPAGSPSKLRCSSGA